jgi:hypothetical protein
MPDTTPSARYDLPWKAALSHAFRPFLQFYFPQVCARIDWRQRPRFRDKEFARCCFGSAPDSMVADKLVEVRLLHGRKRQVLIHIEIQAQRDGALARRMRDYHERIRETCGLPVISLVLLADEHPHWRPRNFHEQLAGTMTDFSFGAAKLLDHATDTKALEASHDPIAWVTLAHLRTQQARHDPDKLYAAKLHSTRLLFLHRWSSKRIIILLNVVNWMMVLPEAHQRRYVRAIFRLEKEHEMRLYNQLEQMFIDNGLKKGLKQGLERGRKEGAVALLERQLTQRFGPLPQTARKKLAKASVAQVETWSDALLEAQSLKQVLK